MGSSDGAHDPSVRFADTSPSRNPRRGGSDLYSAGAGVLKTGTPSVRSSSASAPSVGRTFT